MANFNHIIPDEYLNGGDDFGFTTVDTDEFHQAEQTEREITADVAKELSTGLVENLDSKIENLEGKINAVLLRLPDPMDGENIVDETPNMNRIEEKIDKILSMEHTEMVSALNEQGENIRAIIDEVEERKSQLDDQFNKKLYEVEKTVLPLLINLTKNPDREYLKWPGRAEKVQGYIKEVLEITRGGSDT